MYRYDTDVAKFELRIQCRMKMGVDEGEIMCRGRG